MTIQEMTLAIIKKNNYEVVITRSNVDKKFYNVLVIDSFANVVYSLGEELPFEDAVELQAPFVFTESI